VRARGLLVHRATDMDGYAVIPDGTEEQAGRRWVAMFTRIEDAMEWASARYRGGSFRLCYQRWVVMRTEELIVPSRVDKPRG
jgi:hypothetical protein